MLGQRRGRWASISPAWGQHLVFDRLPERNEWDRGKATCPHLCVQRGDIFIDQTKTPYFIAQAIVPHRIFETFFTNGNDYRLYNK